MAELRLYAGREDLENYEPVLREVLHLFESAIITSLERTMGNYLKSTGGVYRNDLREEWELEEVSKLVSHNNAAERSFAVVKAYLDVLFSQHEVIHTGELFPSYDEWLASTCRHVRQNPNNKEPSANPSSWYSCDVPTKIKISRD